MKIDRGRVEGGLATLQELDLIIRESTTVEIHTLTDRGKLASKGLSERIIIEALMKSDKTIGELQKSISKADFSAGIGFLKKANLIKITKGLVSISDKDKAAEFSLDLQNSLTDLSSNTDKQISANIVKELYGRGLITTNESSIVEVSSKISKTKLKSIEEKEEVSRLTPKMLISESWKNVSFKPYSLSTKPRKIYAGRPNPYKQFLDHLRIKLIGLGFEEMKGPMIEQEFWNFDSLYAAQDHASREDSDILLIKSPTHGELKQEEYVSNVAKTHEDGWKTGSKGHRYFWDPEKAARLLLRPQGTSISARTLAKIQNPPAKYFSIARCFRPDQIDATHDVEFDQTEGIICDPKITFRDLLGMLKTFAVEVAGASEVRFRPDFYPFTSPSVELSAKHPELGYIEFGGAGIFRPEVTRPFGIDYPVLAWGLGVGRLFMTKYGITDIRELFSQNLEWLRDARASSGIQTEGL